MTMAFIHHAFPQEILLIKNEGQAKKLLFFGQPVFYFA